MQPCSSHCAGLAGPRAADLRKANPSVLHRAPPALPTPAAHSPPLPWISCIIPAQSQPHPCPESRLHSLGTGSARASAASPGHLLTQTQERGSSGSCHKPGQGCSTPGQSWDPAQPSPPGSPTAAPVPGKHLPPPRAHLAAGDAGWCPHSQDTCQQPRHWHQVTLAVPPTCWIFPGKLQQVFSMTDIPVLCLFPASKDHQENRDYTKSQSDGIPKSWQGKAEADPSQGKQRESRKGAIMN